MVCVLPGPGSYSARMNQWDAPACLSGSFQAFRKYQIGGLFDIQRVHEYQNARPFDIQRIQISKRAAV